MYTVQPSYASNFRSYICQNTIIYMAITFLYRGNHPECHLEFLKVFNGDKMTSIGVLNVDKMPPILYRGNHPESHLEFLKVFNGDKMTSIGVLNVDKMPPILLNCYYLVLKSPLFNNVISLIRAAILDALRTLSVFVR